MVRKAKEARREHRMLIRLDDRELARFQGESTHRVAFDEGTALEEQIGIAEERFARLGQDPSGSELEEREDQRQDQSVHQQDLRDSHSA